MFILKCIYVHVDIHDLGSLIGKRKWKRYPARDGPEQV